MNGPSDQTTGPGNGGGGRQGGSGGGRWGGPRGGGVERGGVHKTSFPSKETSNFNSGSPSLPAPQFAESRNQVPMDPIFARAYGIPIDKDLATGLVSIDYPQRFASGLFSNPPIAHSSVVRQTADEIPFTNLLDRPVSVLDFDNIGLTPSEQSYVGRQAISQKNWKNTKKIGKQTNIVRANRETSAIPQQAQRNKQGDRILNENGLTVEQQARKDIEDSLCDFYNGEARGQDHPSSRSMIKVNENKKAVLVYYGKDPNNQFITQIESGIKLRYGIQSQNPCLNVQTSEYAEVKDFYTASDRKKNFHIYREHMGYFHIGGQDRLLFQRQSMVADQVTAENLFTLLPTAFGMNISSEAAEFLNQTIDECLMDHNGLEFVGVQLRARAIIRGDSSTAKAINNLSLQDSVKVLVIRASARVNTAMDNFWDSLMFYCGNSSYPFYTQQLDNTQKLKYVNLHNRALGGKVQFEFPYWMQPKSNDGTVPIAAAKSNNALNKFYSLHDYYHRFSIALIRNSLKDVENEVELYNHDRLHLATLKDITEFGIVYLSVEVQGYNRSRPVPLPSKTMKLRCLISDYQQDDAETLDTQPVETQVVESNTSSISQISPGEAENSTAHSIAEGEDHAFDLGQVLDDPAPPVDDLMEFDEEEQEGGNYLEWTASLVQYDPHDEGDFTIAFDVTDSEHLDIFQTGVAREITIKSWKSPLSTNRQLQAVEWASRWIPEDHKDFELQRFIMGHSNDSLKESLMDQCKSDIKRDHVQTYVENLKLNQAQRDGTNRVFRGRKVCVMIQSPSGIDSGETTSLLGTLCGSFGFNCALAASTNEATLSLLVKSIRKFEAIQGTNLENPGSYNLIYFPSLIVTRQLLQEQPHPDDIASNYHHASYIEQLITSDAGDLELEAATAEEVKAREWLRLRGGIIEGDVVPEDKLESYIQLIDETAPNVFFRFSQPFVVISTCNNCANLKEWKVQVKLVAIDKISSILEPDFLIPVSLGPDRVVLTGVDAQPSPRVHHNCQNENYEQLRRDPYTRLRLAYNNKL